MIERTMHCAHCEQPRTFRFDKRDETFDVRGEDIALEVPRWYCTCCNFSVVDASFGDPVERAFDRVRSDRGLLHPVEIRRIRERWDLSQAAFAALLGMSQATINRYEKGALQQEKEDELIRACDSPEHMRSLISRRGDVLAERQRHAVELALQGSVDVQCGERENGLVRRMPIEVSTRSGFRAFDYKRYAAVVAWLCSHISLVTQTKLYKLLFYTDFLCYRSTSRSLTGSVYRKMQYGPVPEGFSNLRSRLEEDDVVMINEVTYQNGHTGEEFRPGPRAYDHAYNFTVDELRVLNLVKSQVGSLAPSDISERSHQEAAWRDAPSRGIISYEKAMELSLALPEPG